MRERTGLDAGDAPEAVVVDRGAWVDSNVDGFRVVLAPLLERMATEQPAVVTTVGSRLTAVQLGGVLAYLSGKVLGQFEAFTTSSTGRLLLVAPNIVAAERHLDVDAARLPALGVPARGDPPRAVRCGAVARPAPRRRDPRLPGAVRDRRRRLAQRFCRALGAVVAAVRGDAGASLLDAVQSEEQRAVFDRITALMSLLEGHADHVMDDVGPEIVPTVAQIRERFEQRRGEPGAVDGLARRLLGLDAKMRQYTEGRSFVSRVVGAVGRDGFNRVWASPETLPTRDEVLDPPPGARRVVPDLMA